MNQLSVVFSPSLVAFHSFHYSIQGMIDMMTCMERVANTPIPRSYSIHLKQCVTLYLFSLPFTLIKDVGWGMIPLVTVVAFTLMGIEGIADEIEMPFGLDNGDLPLGMFLAISGADRLLTICRTILRGS